MATDTVHQLHTCVSNCLKCCICSRSQAKWIILTQKDDVPLISCLTEESHVGFSQSHLYSMKLAGLVILGQSVSASLSIHVKLCRNLIQYFTTFLILVHFMLSVFYSFFSPQCCNASVSASDLLSTIGLYFDTFFFLPATKQTGVWKTE